ncbi:MAG: pyridoxal phosphate-dependent aminotransferase [Pseudomonadota bacterium]
MSAFTDATDTAPRATPDVRPNIREDLRPAIQALPESGIVRVFNHGRTREGLIPMWAGEGDLPTPAFLCEASQAAMLRGETFYTYQRGLPDLRASLARYFARLYDRPFAADEFFVTGGGMQAIQLAMQLTVSDGDDVVILSPAWPNFEGAARGAGASVTAVDLTRDAAGGWHLDLDRLFAACTPRTRALFINSPANPTGWTASQEELAAILAFARERGLWIIADEIYARFYFPNEAAADEAHAPIAPSFQTLREPDDRIIFVNTFSKNWAMTGWRMGWLQAPAALGQDVENLIQYNTSGVPAFHQHAGIAALETAEGEALALSQIERARRGRKIIATAFQGQERVRATPPAGAFYQFFALDGFDDSMETALRLVDEANIGLAPGIAFGPAGEGYYRLCFLRSADALEAAMDRLTTWLAR